MTATTFDTLAYAKKMKAIGFTEQQAEGQAEAISEIIDEKLATKQDLQLQISQLKVDLIKWMIGLFTGWGAILISIMVALRFLH